MFLKYLHSPKTIIYCNSIFQLPHFENILFSMFFFFEKESQRSCQPIKLLKKMNEKAEKNIRDPRFEFNCQQQKLLEVSGGGHFCDQRTLSRDSSPLQKGEFKRKKWPFHQERTVPQVNVVLVC